MAKKEVLDGIIEEKDGQLELSVKEQTGLMETNGRKLSVFAKKKANKGHIEQKPKGLLEQMKVEIQQVQDKIEDLYANAYANDAKANALDEAYSLAEIKALRGQAKQDREQAKYLEVEKNLFNQNMESMEKKVGMIKTAIQNAEIDLSNCTSDREKYKREYENRLEMIEHKEETAKWHIDQGKLELLKLQGGE